MLDWRWLRYEDGNNDDDNDDHDDALIMIIMMLTLMTMVMLATYQGKTAAVSDLEPCNLQLLLLHSSQPFST